MSRTQTGRRLGRVRAALAIASFIAVLPGDASARQAAAGAQAAEYSIEAIRYATLPSFPVSGLVIGAPRDERIDAAMVIWLLRGNGRVILFDAGFHRARWLQQFTIADFIPPDSAVRLAGVAPDDVTDVIVSHAHWDHMGGIDRFSNATIHIQRDEFAYYTGTAWQEGGRRGGIDTEDILELVRRNTAGKVRLVAGDSVEVVPGIMAFTGARHTYASQYIRVAGREPFVLASDNCYLYRNLETRMPGATFDPADRAANLAALARMAALAGAATRVVPGHDMLQFQRYPSTGRVARIRGP
jgi:glyoxylase-like metal-dependent hydrolase (beta-lactamase superfamily II)